MGNLPIACHLTSSELQDRRQTVLAKLHDAVVAVQELTDGYRYSFSSEGNRFKELAEMIDLERQCCPFLEFNLKVAAGSGPLHLDVTGPEGTKDFLLSTFKWRLNTPEAYVPTTT